MQKRVEEKLKRIEEEYHVCILMAIESGSRAWGFASNDSDYDVRFIYVRPINDYLKLEKQRDVIELPVDEVWDINGWDLDKTLRLMAAGNPTLFEWLNSPIVYKTTEHVQQLRNLAESYFDAKRSAYHYLNLAKKVYVEMKGEKVRAKKYLYVLRGLLACQWILEKKSVPPVLFTSLMDEMLSDDLKQACLNLIEVKKVSEESDLIDRIPCFDEYINKQLECLDSQIEQLETKEKKGWEPLNQCFLQLLNKIKPHDICQ